MKNSSDVASGVFLLCLCALGAMSTMQLPKSIETFGSSALPFAALSIIAGCSVILILRGFTGPKGTAIWRDTRAARKIGLYLLGFLLYLFALTHLGALLYDIEDFPFSHSLVFSICTITFLVFSLKFLGRTRPAEFVLIPLGATAFLVAIFSYFFQVLLP
ncbi:tripartite tricarboxylate transporter TctB family protein [Desulfovibrio sp. OttesenSCG-928-O18]|nr:tripartite tricarboxylate transporter TctB family protein [Desulfovibrio sp. OttesenSCG-928-O18]